MWVSGGEGREWSRERRRRRWERWKELMIFLTRELMTFNALDYLFLEVDDMAACVLLTIRSN